MFRRYKKIGRRNIYCICRIVVTYIYFIRIAYIMSYREQCPADCKVYVGGLPERASRGELEEIFGRFGPLRNVWVARRPWGFAFVEFEDARDAIDAVRQLDGSRMCGVRARVELSHGQRRNRGPRGYDDERRGGDRRRLHASSSLISRERPMHSASGNLVSPVVD
ncbi:Serine/arginine-rich splicing factor 3 [Trichinella pseudospiralis]|uniref:Serine/arginine-rich splicing factor 3 n=1 Tax=Trichinella pseudospiralis TaxID=6337 RepID=A0A0V1KFJ4_TRIPS|nr:Serine/arginine-rich splicing factor 3 [Trichinella pseudospiralis]